VPLYKTIIHDLNTKILIWKITESFDDLYRNMLLSANSQNRIKEMKSENHKLGFLAVRKLLQVENYLDSDLFYDASGKPHLIDNKHISISHSHQFATIVISTANVGIDIEMKREKIIKIANKFIHKNEFLFLNPENQLEYIKMLTTIWGAKEAIFKIINQEGISFKNHIILNSFEADLTKTRAVFQINNQRQLFEIYSIEVEEYVLVYAI
jgi:phosphopantetheinyl transferase